MAWKTSTLVELTEAEEWAELVRYASEHLQGDPEASSLYMFRALGHQHTGQPEAAMGDIDRAVELDPASAATYYLRATLLSGRAIQGGTGEVDLRAALEDIDQAVRLDPEDRSYQQLRKQMKSRLLVGSGKTRKFRFLDAFGGWGDFALQLFVLAVLIPVGYLSFRSQHLEHQTFFLAGLFSLVVAGIAVGLLTFHFLFSRWDGVPGATTYRSLQVALLCSGAIVLIAAIAIAAGSQGVSQLQPSHFLFLADSVELEDAFSASSFPGFWSRQQAQVFFPPLLVMIFLFFFSLFAFLQYQSLFKLAIMANAVFAGYSMTYSFLARFSDNFNPSEAQLRFFFVHVLLLYLLYIVFGALSAWAEERKDGYTFLPIFVGGIYGIGSGWLVSEILGPDAGIFSGFTYLAFTCLGALGVEFFIRRIMPSMIVLGIGLFTGVKLSVTEFSASLVEKIDVPMLRYFEERIRAETGDEVALGGGTSNLSLVAFLTLSMVFWTLLGYGLYLALFSTQWWTVLGK
ncbi:MAG: hypothetical protein AAGD01_13660 [Acidobacteriota bacterium]